MFGDPNCDPETGLEYKCKFCQDFGCYHCMDKRAVDLRDRGIIVRKNLPESAEPILEAQLQHRERKLRASLKQSSIVVRRKSGKVVKSFVKKKPVVGASAKKKPVMKKGSRVDESGDVSKKGKVDVKEEVGEVSGKNDPSTHPKQRV